MIIADSGCLDIGQAFFRESTNLGGTPILVEMNPLEEHGNEPPEIIASILKQCDIFIIPTTKSITHTKARREACLYGARGITLPGITEDIFIRTIPIDYKRLSRRTEKIARLLTGANSVYIESEKGTDLRLDIHHQSGHADSGLVLKPGAFSNLPAGEAYIAPVSGHGRLVIDGSVASIGLIKKTITIEIQDGKAVSIREDHQRLRRILSGHGPSALTIGEFGIGTNDHAVISGNILEDEKASGTAHIAFGDNLGFGGDNSAPVHIDCLIRKPTITVDNRKILQNGNFIV